MLFETALARIDDLASDVPRPRMVGLISRLKAGEPVDVSLILEGLSRSDSRRIEELCEHDAFSQSPAFLGDLLEHAYFIYEQRPQLPQIVWTGPRLQSASRTIRTDTAARKIVDSAANRITIAGYHITSENLEFIGIWNALKRGTSVIVLLDGNQLSSVDERIFRAKGLQIRIIRPRGENYSKFHVKAIVADGRVALIGSANFTSLGHTGNIELGLLVENETAASIESALFDYLSVAESTGWLVTE